MTDATERELTWLRRVRDFSHLLATERDAERLLPLILDAAIELTEAERGFLVLVTGRKPDGGYKIRVKVARGFDKAALQANRGHVSRTVVKRVLNRGQALVTTREDGIPVRIGEVADVGLAPMIRQGAVTRDYRVMGLPMTFIVDRQGVIRARIVGESTPEVFERAIATLL